MVEMIFFFYQTIMDIKILTSPHIDAYNLFLGLSLLFWAPSSVDTLSLIDL